MTNFKIAPLPDDQIYIAAPGRYKMAVEVDGYNNAFYAPIEIEIVRDYDYTTGVATWRVELNVKTGVVTAPVELDAYANLAAAVVASVERVRELTNPEWFATLEQMYKEFHAKQRAAYAAQEAANAAQRNANPIIGLEMAKGIISGLLAQAKKATNGDIIGESDKYVGADPLSGDRWVFVVRIVHGSPQFHQDREVNLAAGASRRSRVSTRKHFTEMLAMLTPAHAFTKIDQAA